MGSDAALSFDLTPENGAPLAGASALSADMPRPRPEFSVKDFARALELEPEAVIAFDPQLFGTAANNGQMIEDVSGKSSATQQFRALAGLLTDRIEAKSERVSLFAPILNRLRRRKTRA